MYTVYVWYCIIICVFFFFKQKTAYEMRISDWSSDVCSSDLLGAGIGAPKVVEQRGSHRIVNVGALLEHNIVRHRRRRIVEGLQRRLIRRAQSIIARDIGFRAFATRVIPELLEIPRAHTRGLIGRLIAARQGGQGVRTSGVSGRREEGRGAHGGR